MISLDLANCFLLTVFEMYVHRSSYPDQKEGEMEDEELPDEKHFEYDDDTLELTLPSGNMT